MISQYEGLKIIRQNFQQKHFISFLKLLYFGPFNFFKYYLIFKSYSKQKIIYFNIILISGYKYFQKHNLILVTYTSEAENSVNTIFSNKKVQ